MRCNVRDVTFLHITAMFIRPDMGRWAAAYNGVNVIQSHHLPNGMLFAFAGVLFNHNQERIFSLSLSLSLSRLCALISEMICSHAAAPHCATGNFCAWRVPRHNDEGKSNLISTFIYRTDCSNGVITISLLAATSPCLTLILALLLSLPAYFGPIHSFKNAFETMQMGTSEQMNVSWMLLWWENANEDEWMNECLMNAC